MGKKLESISLALSRVGEELPGGGGVRPYT